MSPEGTSLVPPDFLALNLLSPPAGNATSACVSFFLSRDEAWHYFLFFDSRLLAYSLAPLAVGHI